MTSLKEFYTRWTRLQHREEILSRRLPPARGTWIQVSLQDVTATKVIVRIPPAVIEEYLSTGNGNLVAQWTPTHTQEEVYIARMKK